MKAKIKVTLLICMLAMTLFFLTINRTAKGQEGYSDTNALNKKLENILENQQKIAEKIDALQQKTSAQMESNQQALLAQISALKEEIITSRKWAR